MKQKILVAASMPPPVGGMSMMIEIMMKGEYGHATLIQIATGLSDSIDEVAKFKFKKILRLIRVIARIAFSRVRYGTKVLYYPPAGESKGAMYRDFIILICTRWLFDKTIFHFHASGVCNLYPRLNSLMKWVYRRAYFLPDIAIRTSDLNPQDGSVLRASKEFVVPNGIPDDFRTFGLARGKSRSNCQLLYLGLLCETKGVMVLLEAYKILKNKGRSVQLTLVGKFESSEFESQCLDFLNRQGLIGEITFRQQIFGKEKFELYANSDIFCFPTYFESESFGIVLLEAMQSSLPIVATDWRGISSVVMDGISGYIVPIKDPIALASKIELLLINPALRRQMGKKGREIYEQRFTEKHFQHKLDECFKEI